MNHDAPSQESDEDIPLPRFLISRLWELILGRMAKDEIVVTDCGAYVEIHLIPRDDE